MTLTRSNRVLITGGSGFVGTNLVSFFADQGWEVRNFDVSPPRNKNHTSYWRNVDILHRKRLIEAVQDFQPSVLLHFAARTDLNETVNLAGYVANIEGVCNVVDAVRSTPSVERVIFASSQLVCRLGYSPADEYDYQPTTLYGQSKMLGERIIRNSDEIGATWTIVRPTSLWGPWFDVPYKNFFLAIARNIYVHPGETKVAKQWGFVGNAVFQVWKLIHTPAAAVHKQLFYMADYEPVPLQEFADNVQVALQAKPIKTVSRKVLELAARLGDYLQTLGWKSPPLTSFRYQNMVTPESHDLEPLRHVVGPLPCSVEQGIEITARWLREQDSKETRKGLSFGGRYGKHIASVD